MVSILHYYETFGELHCGSYKLLDISIFFGLWNQTESICFIEFQYMFNALYIVKKITSKKLGKFGDFICLV